MSMPKFSTIAFKFIIIIECIYGPFIFSAATGIDMYGMRLFATIGCLICGVYYIAATLKVLIFKPHDFRELPFPEIKGICTLLLTFSGVCYFCFGRTSFELMTIQGLGFFVLNIVCPVIVLTDWIAFSNNGRISKFMPLKALPILLIYFGVIFGTAGKMDTNATLRYPYDYLNVDLIGRGEVIRNVIILTIIFLLIGYLIYFTDKGLAKYQGWLEKANDDVFGKGK